MLYIYAHAKIHAHMYIYLYSLLAQTEQNRSATQGSISEFYDTEAESIDQKVRREDAFARLIMSGRENRR